MEQNGKLYLRAVTFFLALVMLLGCMSLPVLADPDDPLEWMPLALQGSVHAYLPLDGDYEDVMGNVDVEYYNKVTRLSYGTDALATSGATFVAGRDGKQAIKFGDGVYGSQGNSSNLNLGQVDYTDSFTISFWTKGLFDDPYTGEGGYGVLFGNANWDATSGTTHDGIIVSTLKTKAIIMNLQAQGVARISPRPIYNSPDPDGWHYVTMTGDRTSGKFTLFVDGIILIDGEETNGLISTSTAGGLYTNSIGKSLQNTSPTRLGADGYSNYGYYGAVSDFVIFDKCLTELEVGTLYAAYGFELPTSITLN